MARLSHRGAPPLISAPPTAPDADCTEVLVLSTGSRTRVWTRDLERYVAAGLVKEVGR